MQNQKKHDPILAALRALGSAAGSAGLSHRHPPAREETPAHEAAESPAEEHAEPGEEAPESPPEHDLGAEYHLPPPPGHGKFDPIAYLKGRNEAPEQRILRPPPGAHAGRDPMDEKQKIPPRPPMQKPKVLR